MPQKYLSYATFDTCVNAFLLLNCDGTVNTEYDPIIFCGLTESTIRETVSTIDAVEVAGQQSGKPCLEREESTIKDSCFLDLTTCGVEHPLLWWAMNQYDLYKDTNGEVCGFEPKDDTIDCDVCSKVGTAACAHRLALISIRQAWCRKGPHPDFPYVAVITPSIIFEPQENEISYTEGFNSSRSFSGKLKKNPNFIDPWGIVTLDDPVQRKFRNQKLLCPEGSLIEELVETACGCDDCQAVEEAIAA